MNENSFQKISFSYILCMKRIRLTVLDELNRYIQKAIFRTLLFFKWPFRNYYQICLISEIKHVSELFSRKLALHCNNPQVLVSRFSYMKNNGLYQQLYQRDSFWMKNSNFLLATKPPSLILGQISCLSSRIIINLKLQMLTRKMRINVENRRKSYYKKIVMRWCIERFRNPNTNYQPYHNVHFSEEMLKDGGIETTYMGALFDFNRITKAYKLQDILAFEMSPTGQCATSLQYLIDRFQSFGNKTHFKLAETLKIIVDMDAQHYTPEEQALFPTPEQIAEKYRNSLCIIIGGSFSENGLTSDRLYITDKWLEEMGYNAEEFMLNATKVGSITLEEPGNFNLVTRGCEDQIFSYLQSQIDFKNCVNTTPNPTAIQEIVDKNSLVAILRTVKKDEIVQWRCTFQTITPNHFAIIFDEISSKEPMKAATPEDFSTQIQIEETEYDVLQHLVFVPENRLRVNKPFVCRVRDRQQ